MRHVRAIQVESEFAPAWELARTCQWDLWSNLGLRWALWSDVDYSRPREVLNLDDCPADILSGQGGLNVTLAALHGIRYLDLSEHRRLPSLHGRWLYNSTGERRQALKTLPRGLSSYYRNGLQVHPFDVARLFKSLGLGSIRANQFLGYYYAGIPLMAVT